MKPSPSNSIVLPVILMIVAVGLITAIVKNDWVEVQSDKVACRSLSDTNRWLRIFEIWQCNDGTFDVKTTYGLIGRFHSLAEAEDCRYEHAKRDADLFAVPENRGPDCGVRIK